MEFFIILGILLLIASVGFVVGAVQDRLDERKSAAEVEAKPSVATAVRPRPKETGRHDLPVPDDPYNDYPFLKGLGEIGSNDILHNNLVKIFAAVTGERGLGILASNKFVDILNVSYNVDKTTRMIIAECINDNIYDKLHIAADKKSFFAALENIKNLESQKLSNYLGSTEIADVLNIVLCAFAVTINKDLFVSVTVPCLSNYQVIPASASQPKVVLRKYGLNAHNVSVNYLDVARAPKGFHVQFEVTNISEAAVASQPHSQPSYITLTAYHQNIVVGHYLLAVVAPQPNMLLLINKHIQAAQSELIDKMVIEFESSHAPYLHTNSASYNDKDLIVSRAVDLSKNAFIASLNSVLALNSQRAGCVKDCQISYFESRSANSAEPGLIVLFIGQEYAESKPLGKIQLLIYDHNELLRQKIDFEMNFRRLPYNRYNFLGIKPSRLDAKEIGKIKLIDLP